MFIPCVHAQSKFKINQVVYHFGRTKISAFKRYFGSLESAEFARRDQLDKALDDLRQRIYKSNMFRAFEVEAIFSESGTDGVQNVDLIISVKDSWPAMAIALPLYSTSAGFILGGGGMFPNVNGQLFDIMTSFNYNAEPRGGGFAWSDPFLKGGIAISKIPLGHDVFLGVSGDIIRDSNTIRDRGREVYTYYNISWEDNMSVLWHANDQWSLLNTVKFISALAPNVKFDIRNDEEYGLPRRYFYEQKFIAGYNGTKQNIQNIPIGLSSQMMIGYSYAKTFSNFEDHAFFASWDINYTWNVADIFYPSLSAYTFYKTGLPEFNLAVKMRGIVDGEWRGNGVSVFSADFLFYVYQLPGWFAIHMGPYVDYGVSYGEKQRFERNDQGFDVGVRLKVLMSMAPSTPLYVDMGFDLRDKYSWRDFMRHFEISIGSSFSI